MKALLVLYAGNLSKYAFEPIHNGKNSVSLALEQALKFPGVEKTVLLSSGDDFSFLSGVQIEQKDSWTKRNLLEKIAELQSGFDLIYFAFADCPFLDPSLAGSIADRHVKNAAEYSYADGWPFGLAPETLSLGTAGILANISGEDGPVQRDILFSVIQKDINAFDIEAEISEVDLSCHRLSLCADSKRNFLLLKNFLSINSGKIPSSSDVHRIILEQPEILRTLPAFYPIQVYGGCPQACKICPYPSVRDVLNNKEFMPVEKFESLLDKIIGFSGDAAIDLSLWGELSQHPDKMKLIEAVAKRKELSLIIETSGLGWKSDELEKCKSLFGGRAANGARENSAAPISWIVSLDAADSKKYQELRGNGFAEAENCAKTLLSLFPNDCYVQAVRIKGSEEDTEKFYRYWKDAAPNGEKNIIIQKYDDYCSSMEKMQASDISPVIRQCCWHIMRDMPVLIDGTVLLCKEDLSIFKGHKNWCLGNAFNDSLESIWLNGERFYKEQCKKQYLKQCMDCDEYYTFNF